MLVLHYDRVGLLPDTCYARNGPQGISLVMPDLTYEQLKTYHQTYFHPSNSYFFCYGNIPTDDYLVFLADKLAALPKAETRRISTSRSARKSHSQPKWKSPRTITDTYPIGAEEPLRGTNILDAQLDHLEIQPIPKMSFCVSILNLILFGNEGALLRKALIDSKLGTDIRYDFLKRF